MKPLYLVDSFTAKPFFGNPAGVCLLDSPAEESWMQRVAAEVNVSETAYLLKTAEGFQIRWFTPTVEVSLCGHATLAAAHILWETDRVQKTEGISFQSASGKLLAKRAGDLIELDFPQAPLLPTAVPTGLMEALGVTEKPRFCADKGADEIIIELTTEALVKELIPNLSLLRQVNTSAVIVTSESEPGKPYDYVARFFGPKIGLDEDPVTGSAHCALGPYWGAKRGKQQLIGYQASARGGMVRTRMQGSDRVILGGQAVTVYEARLRW